MSTTSDDKTFILSVVDPTYRLSVSRAERIAAMIYDAIRFKNVLPTSATDVPHGPYLVEDDPTASEPLLFMYVEGDDPQAALRAAREAKKVKEEQTSDAPPVVSTVSGGEGRATRSSAPASRQVPEEWIHGFESSLNIVGERPRFIAPIRSPRRRTPDAGDKRVTYISYGSDKESETHSDEASEGHSDEASEGRSDDSGSNTSMTFRNAELQIDKNALIPLTPEFLQTILSHCKMYTVNINIDGKHENHRHQLGVGKLPLRLLLDTGSDITWVYGYGFQRIEKRGERTRSWTEEDQRDTRSAGGIRFLAPPPGVHWKVRNAPRHPNEHTLRYEDNSVVYVRHLVGKDIIAQFPCWSWQNSIAEKVNLSLDCILAYGANKNSVAFPIDGVLGLDIPIPVAEAEDRPPRHFIHALMATRHVEEPRCFTIKLNHPDDLAECGKTGAMSLLYFGYEFPCELRPEFTPPIPVLGRSPDRSTGEARYPYDWCVDMLSIALRVPKESPTGSSSAADIEYELYKITFPLPKVDSKDRDSNRSKFSPQRTSPPSRDRADSIRVDTSRETSGSGPAGNQRRVPFPVLLDTGSFYTYLPEDAVREIAETWLLNEPRVWTTTHSARIYPYCGEERDLSKCDVVFEFANGDQAPITYMCPAQPFLKSYRPHYDWPGKPTRFECNISHIPRLDEDLKFRRGPKFILGINFFWSTFVKFHVGDLDVKTQRTRQSCLQLAPQRGTKDGKVYSARDFVPFQGGPPRWFD